MERFTKKKSDQKTEIEDLEKEKTEIIQKKEKHSKENTIRELR